jgi:uncharacterized protein YcfJ
MVHEDVMKLKFYIVAALLLLAGTLSAQTPAAPGGPASGEEGAHYGWAAVLRVDPVYDEPSATVQQQECYEEQVPLGESGPEDHGKRTMATMIGAVVGGLLGNQVGKGDGRQAATVAGAVAGGAIGNQVAREPPQYTTQRHCRPIGVGPGPRHVVAYDVEYRYRGEVFTSRVAYDPGDRMRVRVSVTPAD